MEFRIHLAYFCLSGLLALGCLSGLEIAHAQADSGSSEADPDRGLQLARARLWLGHFQKALDSDDEKANRAYEELLKLPDYVQEGFGRYLDGEWETRSKDYRLAASRSESRSGGPAVTASVSMEDRTRAREHQQVLATIRAMPNETEMKKALKARGWTELQSLLGIFKRGENSGSSGGGGSDPTLPAKRVAALKIGKFWHKFHTHAGTPPAQSPEEILGLVSEKKKDVEKKEEVVKISASASDRAILKKNEELFPGIEKAEADGIRQLNEWRIAAGLIPLEVDPKLCAAARDHCNDMAGGGFFSHTSPVPGKKSFTDRARNFGTSARGENIAINSSSLSANNSWFYSPGHHRNMFGNYTAIGFGASGRHFTQMFR